MDSSPDRLKQLGACGIIGDSFRVIFSKKSIFTAIAILLIVPVCVLLLFQSRFVDFFLLNTLNQDNGAPLDADGNRPVYMAIRHNKFGWAVVLAIVIVYYSIVAIISLIAISAIAYTVACVYASKDAAFGKIMSVFPKVWIRMIVTFFWVLLVLVVYLLIFVGLIFMCTLFPQTVGIIVAILLLIACAIGLVYFTILTSLTYVVSVLDDEYGRRALSKSKALLKGKLGTVIGFFVIFSVCTGLVEFGFSLVWSTIGILAIKILFVIGICLVFAFVYLVFLTAFTVIYFVCKSHHQERLDMVIIADRLDNYQHVPKYAQFQQSHV